MECKPPDSSVHGVVSARLLEWDIISFSRGSSRPRDQSHGSCISYIIGEFFTSEPPGKLPMYCCFLWASLVAQLVKNLPAMRETRVQSLGWEDPLENGKATHSSILAWRIPWTVWSMGSQRVGRHCVTSLSVIIQLPLNVCVYVCICCYCFDVFLFQFESQTAGALSLPHFDLQHLAQCLAKPGIKNMYWVHGKQMPKSEMPKCSEPEHHKLYFTYLVSSIENILWPSFETYYFTSGLRRCFSGKVSTCQCRRAKDMSSIAGSGDPQEEEMATNSNILAWEIPWTEEPGGLQFMGYQRVRHNWAHTHTHTIYNIV